MAYLVSLHEAPSPEVAARVHKYQGLNKLLYATNRA